MMTPKICSIEHSFLNITKLKNIVPAFLVVVVIDIVNAPNLFVIAAAHEPPKMPKVEKRKMATAFFCDVQVDVYSFAPVSIATNSLNVPSDKKKNLNPLPNSPE